MLSTLLPQIFLGGAQRRLCAEGVPVFTWHYLGAAPANAADPFLYVSAARFGEQLAALRAAGFRSASLDEISAPSADARAVLTFDDGAVNVLRHGLAPLAEHGFRAIQFLVAAQLGGCNEWDTVHGAAPEPLMDAVQVREWLAAGHEIGSHSLTHRNLTKLDEAAAREQITASKQRLEDTLGVPVRHFCYPHGQWNERVRALVAEAGYATACTTGFGVNTTATPRHTLLRIQPLSSGELLGKVVHRLTKRVFAPGRGST